MIIYKITNRINGMVYIGQTKKAFRKGGNGIAMMSIAGGHASSYKERSKSSGKKTSRLKPLIMQRQRMKLMPKKSFG